MRHECLKNQVETPYNIPTFSEPNGNPRYFYSVRSIKPSALPVILIIKVYFSVRAGMKRHALAGGGSLLSLGIVWSQAMCAKVGVLSLCRVLSSPIFPECVFPRVRLFCFPVLLIVQAAVAVPAAHQQEQQ